MTAQAPTGATTRYAALTRPSIRPQSPTPLTIESERGHIVAKMRRAKLNGEQKVTSARPEWRADAEGERDLEAQDWNVGVKQDQQHDEAAHENAERDAHENFGVRREFVLSGTKQSYSTC